MSAVFVDTSGLVALISKDDKNHASAHRFWKSLLKEPVPLYLTDYIFDETYTILAKRLGHQLAVGFGDLVIQSEAVHLINIDEALFDEAWKISREYDDKTYSFTDCTSFAAMRSLGLEDVFSFDRHFTQHGFAMKP